MNEDKRARKEDVIAEAAYRLLAERGFAGTSMLAIAKAAKSSNETLYNWYGDKTGLFRALVVRNADDTARALEAGLAGDDDPLDVLGRAGATLLAILLGPRAVALNQAAAADPTGTLGEALSSGGRARIAPLVAGLVARATAAGRLAGDPRTMTETYFALLIADSQIRRVIGAMPEPTPDVCAARARAAVAGLKRLHAVSSKDETSPLDAPAAAD